MDTHATLPKEPNNSMYYSTTTTAVHQKHIRNSQQSATITWYHHSIKHNTKALQNILSKPKDPVVQEEKQEFFTRTI